MKSLSSGKIKLCQFNPAVLPVDIKPVPLKLYLNKPPESDDDDDDDGGTALALKVREGKNNQGDDIVPLIDKTFHLLLVKNKLEISSYDKNSIIEEETTCFGVK